MTSLDDLANALCEAADVMTLLEADCVSDRRTDRMVSLELLGEALNHAAELDLGAERQGTTAQVRALVDAAALQALRGQLRLAAESAERAVAALQEF